MLSKQVVININKRTGEEFPLKNIHYCMPPPKFLYGTRTYTTIKLKYDVSSVLNVVFNEHRAKFNPENKFASLFTLHMSMVLTRKCPQRMRSKMRSQLKNLSSKG